MTLVVLQPPPPPPNDAFAAAASLPPVGTGSLTGTSVGATKETGEPAHAGNTGGASVWWRFTATAAGAVTLDTSGSGFDTTLGVYTGPSVGALVTVASNDDNGSGGLWSRVSVPIVAGTTYYVAVDGWNGATGPVTLNWAGLPADAPALSGVVHGPAGPVRGAQIRVYPSSGAGPSAAVATGPDGTWTVALPSGTYQVQVVPPSGRFLRQWIGGAQRSSATTFVVAAGVFAGDITLQAR
jgi:hypothetical protein